MFIAAVLIHSDSFELQLPAMYPVSCLTIFFVSFMTYEMMVLVDSASSDCMCINRCMAVKRGICGDNEVLVVRQMLLREKCGALFFPHVVDNHNIRPAIVSNCPAIAAGKWLPENLSCSANR